MYIRNLFSCFLKLLIPADCPSHSNPSESLRENNFNIHVYDKYASSEEVNKIYNIKLTDNLSGKYHAIIIAVPHNDFIDLNYEEYLMDNGFIFDLKNCLKRNDTLKL